MTMSQQNDPYERANDEGEIYSPAMDDGNAFDAREQTGRRAMLLLAGGFAALLLIALIILKAYSPGTRGDGEPPRITADTSPYKSAPENPGGEQTPNQDKTVYDVISGETRSDDVNLVPDSENPVTVTPTPNQATVTIKKPEVVTAAPSTSTAPAPRPQVQTPPPANTYVGPGDYMVQVASLRSQAQADESWSNLNKKVGDLIPSSLYADIERKDLGARGIRFRLRVAGFGDKAAASKFCESLKARSQDCLVVKR